jgi:hypothetical protein
MSSSFAAPPSESTQRPTRLPAARCKRGRIGLTLGVVGVAAALALWARTPASPSAGDETALAGLEFCAPIPAEAQVAPGTSADWRYAAQVPLANPAPDAVLSATSHPVGKGDVVRFDVTSPRRGAITVHGLHDLQRVQVGSTVSITFRAIYTGRFPLHFHGVDGSHFELAALEVLPGPLARHDP